MSAATELVWVAVCGADELIPDRGAAALVAGRQVAVFLLSDGAVHAIANRDPRTGANVLSRGLVGDLAGRPTVASPLLKQRYDLATGEAVDGGEPVRTWPARVVGGRVEVAVA